MFAGYLNTCIDNISSVTMYQYFCYTLGSVVDQDVTRKEWYDYFLVSQSVRQGTVTPTHYNVIHDTTGLKPDHMQRLTYKMTHLYYNWPVRHHFVSGCLLCLV